jgi:hypothetical protein
MMPRVRFAAGPAILLLAACAGRGGYPALPAPETLPGNSPLLSRSLGRTDAWLRHYVMEGHPDSAVRLLDAASPVRPRDELVRQLQLGLVYHYAGKWEASNAAFEWAEGEAAGRWTRSLTQQAGELLLNDAVADYLPPAGEMALIPYYRMLNYLALGSSDGALVEARKASEWLARLNDGRDACVGDGFVHYLAGTAFSGAGERNDALVAFRNAERSFQACGGKDEALAPPWRGADLYQAARAAGVAALADSAQARYRLAQLPPAGADGSGELVVLVENGWVAHRATAAVHVPIFASEVEGVDGSDAGKLAEATARVVARLAGNLQERAWWGEAWDDQPGAQLAAAASGAYVMRLAWPEFQMESSLAPGVRVVVDGQEMDAPVADDVSAVLLRRWQSQRPEVFSRLVARAILKYLATHALEGEARKHGRAAGWITGRMANLAGNALERADTRGWTLLPDRIGVARFTLPAGTHTLRLELLDPAGEVRQALDLGSITLQPGGTLVLNRRVWGSEMGDVRGLYARAAPRQSAQTP